MQDQLKPGAFFRAFDITFFVPGAVLFITLLVCQILPLTSHSGLLTNLNSSNKGSLDNDPMVRTLQESEVVPSNPRVDALATIFRPTGDLISAQAIIQLAASIVFCYVLGLVCHAISWPIGKRFLFGLRRSDDIAADSWTTNQDFHLQYAIYFWYLRSTCLTLGVAILLSSLVISIPSPGGGNLSVFDVFVVILSGVVAASFLFLLASTFDASYRERKQRCQDAIRLHKNPENP